MSDHRRWSVKPRKRTARIGTANFGHDVFRPDALWRPGRLRTISPLNMITGIWQQPAAATHIHLHGSHAVENSCLSSPANRPACASLLMKEGCWLLSGLVTFTRTGLPEQHHRDADPRPAGDGGDPGHSVGDAAPSWRRQLRKPAKARCWNG
jgi:hypothetical protein